MEELESGEIARLEYEDKKGRAGWVEFRDFDDLTGADMKRLRRGAGSSENNGEASNVFYAEAFAALITAWDVPGKPDLPIPKQNAKNIDYAPAGFVRAIERHLDPFLDELMRSGKRAEDNGEPGSPPQPARG